MSVVIILAIGLLVIYLLQKKIKFLTEEKNQNEEKLKALEAVIDAIPAIICWIDSNAYYLGVNHYLAQTLSLSPEEFLGKRVNFREELADFSQFVNNFLANSKLKDYQIVKFSKQTKQKFYLIAAQKYQKNSAFVLVGIDITKLITTQKLLEEKDTLLQLVLDNIPELIFWKDRNYIFRGCNRLWAKAIGLEKSDDIIGKNDYDLYPNNKSVDLYRKQDFQVIETGKPKYLLEYKPDKDKWFDTKKIPIKDKNQNIVGILSTVKDITKQRKTEEALRLAEENYRSIFENALNGIFQSSPEGKYLKVNRAMAEIYGYDSPEEMINSIKNIDKIYVDKNGRKKLQKLLEIKGKVQKWEYQVYDKNKKIIWIQEDVRAVFNCNKELLYYEGIIQDITERKLTEENFKKQLKELKINIDERKKEKDVQKITESTYFQQLKQQISNLDLDSFWEIEEN